MLVELSVMEQRYQAVLAVEQDGWKVVEVVRRPVIGSPIKGILLYPVKAAIPEQEALRIN